MYQGENKWHHKLVNNSCITRKKTYLQVSALKPLKEVPKFVVVSSGHISKDRDKSKGDVIPIFVLCVSVRALGHNTTPPQPLNIPTTNRRGTCQEKTLTFEEEREIHRNLRKDS